jgi:hypothetical protein
MVPRPVDWAEVGSALLSDAKSGVIQVGRPLPRPLADAAASSALRPSNVLRPRRRGRRTSPTALAWDRYARALCGAGSSIANHPNIARLRSRRGPDTTLALVGCWHGPDSRANQRSRCRNGAELRADQAGTGLSATPVSIMTSDDNRTGTPYRLGNLHLRAKGVPPGRCRRQVTASSVTLVTRGAVGQTPPRAAAAQLATRSIRRR